MKSMILATTAALTLTGCAGLEVREARSADWAGQQGEPGSPDELLCRQEKVAGSILRRRVCMTRAERAAIKEDSEDATRSIQDTALRGCAGSSCGG